MDSNIEKIEQYLKSVHVPQHVSDSHREQLRERILRRIEARQSLSRRRRRWEVTGALAALICLAGAAGAFVVAKHGILGRGPAGAYESVGESRGQAQAAGASDTDSVTTAEQTAGDLQDTEATGQGDNAEVVQVIESEVNGRLAGRMLIQKCVLSDGQTRIVGQADLNGKAQNVLVTLPVAARREMNQLRQAGKGESLGTQERQMKGRTFLFKRERYTLRDGTTITLSVGEPKGVKQPLPDAAAGNHK
jgi:hypothetical protein